MKERVAPDVLSGKARICLAISEPEGGSDVANIVTTAVKSPDGSHYLVNGTKKWITQVPPCPPPLAREPLTEGVVPRRGTTPSTLWSRSARATRRRAWGRSRCCSWSAAWKGCAPRCDRTTAHRPLAADR
jgi:hypothetical protein